MQPYFVRPSVHADWFVDGESEERIGAAFAALGVLGQPEQPTVVTKVDMSKIIDPHLSKDGSDVAAHVDASLQQSLARLRTDSLDVLLLHSFAGYREVHGGAAWKRLVELRNEGWVRRVGVSCYAPEEVMEALRDPDMGHIQLPFNLLDRRFKTAVFRAACAARPDVTIHTRYASTHNYHSSVN